MPEHSLKHVAIIPDGNRRWAKQKNLYPWQGHEEGVKIFERILHKARTMNIYCLSFWGMSTDNMTKREEREVSVLLKIFETLIKKALESKELAEDDVRISILGKWREKFPASLVSIFEEAIESTKHRTKHVLNIFLCYDGKTEMMEAFQKAREAKDFSSPKEFLMTKDLPPVDLVVRTGGEPHLSAGFMMWDVADAQLAFSDKLWPDFTEDDFEDAVNDFFKRERRFGA